MAKEELETEVRKLREAIRRLADQDATLSVCDGNVIVTMDATLTDAEREAVQRAMASIADTPDYASQQAEADYATLRGLLERTRTSKDDDKCEKN